MSHRSLTYFTAISLAAHAAAFGFWPAVTQESPRTAETQVEIGLVSLPHVQKVYSRALAPTRKSTRHNDLKNSAQAPADSVEPGATAKIKLDARKTPRIPVVPTTPNETQATVNTRTSPLSSPTNPSALPEINPVTTSRAAPISAANSPPAYPAMALRNGWEGEVRLNVSISRTGAVKAIEIEQSSDYTILDQAAINTVRSWKFEPARVGNEATEGSVQVPIRFRIKRT